MKTLSFLSALAIAAASPSCKRDPTHAIPIPEAKAADPVPPALIPLPPGVEARLRSQGQAITETAFGALSSRLGKAIAETGYTNAIAFCSVHGIPLTTAVGVTNQVTLRRVTQWPRNPKNRADANELAILRQYERELGQGLPLQPVVRAHKPETYTYYAPILLNLPLCLNCHGNPGTEINVNVLAEIRKTYPADEAIGFKSGQLRGLWSVDFKRTDFPAAP